jgi:hypothetical protein
MVALGETVTSKWALGVRESSCLVLVEALRRPEFVLEHPFSGYDISTRQTRH